MVDSLDALTIAHLRSENKQFNQAIVNRQIIFSQESSDYAWESPSAMLELFSWVARKNYFLSYPVIRAIEQNVDRMSPLFQAPGEAGGVPDFNGGKLHGPRKRFHSHN